jgi:cell division protein FtsI/penicillin-binding protein 2
MPAEKPSVTFVIFLEHGGQGGVAGAQMAKLLATYMKENELI